MRFHSFATRSALAIALAATMAACSGADSVNGPVPVATVTLTAVPSLAVGQKAMLAVSLTDAEGKPLAGRAVAWSSSAQAVASVSTAGEVTAVSPGIARITATSEGKQASVQLTVVPRAALVDSVTLDVQTLTLAINETRQLVATALDANHQPVSGVTIGWGAAGATTAASVSATGVVTALQMGTMTISASVGGKIATAIVTVLGDASHDLMFDRWATLGGVERPSLHRLDMRDPDAVALPAFQLSVSSDAAPSPNGRRVAFVCDDDGPAICVADHDGANATVLAPFRGISALMGDQPSWSPDGAKIAFRGWAPGGSPGLFNPTDVWVVDADGSNAVRLTAADSAVDYFESPTWAPHQAGAAGRIAFSHGTRGADGHARSTIQSIRADGTDLQAVTSAGDYVDSHPAWSPDAGTIAFIRTGGSASGDIWLASANGGNERSLFTPGSEPVGAQRAPAWSPDGGLIAFTSNHEIISNYYAWQVYTVRADGTSLLRRTDDHADKDNPSWIKRL